MGIFVCGVGMLEWVCLGCFGLYYLVVGDVGCVVGQFYLVLFDEGLQQVVQWQYYCWVVVDFVGFVLFDYVDVVVFDVVGDDFGKCVVQVGCQFVGWQVVVELEVGYVFVGWFEWVLEVFIDFQYLVEVEGVVVFVVELFYFFQVLGYLFGYFGWVVDDDLVVVLCCMVEGCFDEFMELLQVGFGVVGIGEDDWEGQVLVVWVYEDVQQVEEFFCGFGVVGEDDDFVVDVDEGFQVFFDVWQDYQFVDDWVWCFGGDDFWFGQVQVVVVDDVLFGVVDGGVFYWFFYYFWFVVGVDIQVVQVEFVVDFFGVFVFFVVD